MFWIIPGILSHLLWAFENIGDKYILEHRIKNPYVYLMLFVFTSIAVVGVAPVVNLRLDYSAFWLLLSAGMLYFYGGMAYVKAMQSEEATRVNIWWSFIPIMSLGLGWFLFDETLASSQMLAVGILVFGAVVASFHARSGAFVLSKAMWLMVLASFSFALYGVLIHEATADVSFMSAFVWTHLFQVVGAFSLFVSKKIRNDFAETVRSSSPRLLALIFFIAALGHSGVLLNQWALSLTPAALVFSLEGLQMVFVFAIATFFSYFFPRIVKEEIDRKNIILKLIALVLMVAGLAVLSF